MLLMNRIAAPTWIAIATEKLIMSATEIGTRRGEPRPRIGPLGSSGTPRLKRQPRRRILRTARPGV